MTYFKYTFIFPEMKYSFKMHIWFCISFLVVEFVLKHLNASRHNNHKLHILVCLKVHFKETYWQKEQNRPV